MRLLKPSPGECIDRQTILWLKIQYGSAIGEPIKNVDISERETGGRNARVTADNVSPINVQPFIDENELIQQHLESNWYTEIASDDEVKQLELENYTEELAELNHLIWKLTDQAHVLKDAPDRMAAQANIRAAEVLYTTIELNDKRAKLVRDINALFEIRTVEKIFA